MTWAWFIVLGIVALIARRGIAGWLGNWRDESLKQWAIGGLIFFGLMATFGVASLRALWFIHLAAAVGGIMGFFAVSELTGRSSRRASARRLDEVRQRLEERQVRRERLRTSSLRKAAEQEPPLITPAGSPAHVTDILALVAKRWEREGAAEAESGGPAARLREAKGPAVELDQAAAPGEAVPEPRRGPMRINLAVESKLGREPVQAVQSPPPPPTAPPEASDARPVPPEAPTPPPLVPVSEAEDEVRAVVAPLDPVTAEATEPPEKPEAEAPGVAPAVADRPAGPVSLGQAQGRRPSGPVSLAGPSTLLKGRGPVSLGQPGGRPAPQGPAKLERKLAYEPCLVESRLGGAPGADEEGEPEAQAKGGGQVVEV